jgi:hypothetical protein
LYNTVRRQMSSTVIEVLHLKNRSTMMQTIQDTLTTAQDERLDTLLQTKEAGQPILALRIGLQQDPTPAQVPAQRR